MTEYNPEVEEIDLEDVDLYEGDPDSDVSPTHRSEGDVQDDEFDAQEVAKRGETEEDSDA